MPKKQTTKTRTRTKELPRKEKKLTTEKLKKVKGGGGDSLPLEEVSFNYGKVTYRGK